MESFNNVEIGASIKKLREKCTSHGRYELYLLSIDRASSYIVYICNGNSGSSAQFFLAEEQMNELFELMYKCELDHEHLGDVAVDNLVSLNL